MISAINTNLNVNNRHPKFGNNSAKTEEKANNFVKNSIVTPLKNGGTATHTIASLLIPGLGQFLQDRNEAGLNQLVAKGTLLLLTGALSFTRNMVIGLIGTLAHIGVNIYSAVDANKHGKAEKKEAKPEQPPTKQSDSTPKDTEIEKDTKKEPVE